MARQSITLWLHRILDSMDIAATCQRIGAIALIAPDGLFSFQRTTQSTLYSIAHTYINPTTMKVAS